MRFHLGRTVVMAAGNGAGKAEFNAAIGGTLDALGRDSWCPPG